MVNLRILQSYRVLRSIFFFALAVISFQQFLAPVAQAYGEQYSWVDSMTIRATGGRYGSQTFEFKAGTRYNPGRDNIPQFDIVDQVNDTGDGCVLHPILTFSGKNAGRATFSADPESPLDCPSETVAKYDARINLLHTENQSTTHASNRTIKVTSRITKSNPYPNNSDTITLKETRSGDVVGTKHVGSSDAYSDVDWLGYKTSFNNLSNDLAYTACSKSLGVCQSGIRNPNTGTPADDIADEITITKIIEGGSDGDSATTCVVDGVGWIVCTVANFMATITDGMYEHVIANMLSVPPLNVDTADGENGTYNAWSSIRNIANVLFVIAFLIVVYSQITGLGISNYAIKKMLPRIVLSAILVNLSYWIAAVGVDVSNILGAGIYDMLQGIRGGLNIGNVNGWAAVTTMLLSGGAIAGGVVLGGAITVVAVGAMTPAIAMALIGILLPLLLGALLAIFIVIFILVARQALVVILIIASPLAFVAFLLPNTQQWFTKWRQWFVSLLLLYPIVSFMVGGAQIAGLVLISTASNGFTDVIGDTIKIMSGLFVMVVPFFFLPFMIRRYGGAGLDRLAGSIKAKGGKLIAPVGKVGRKMGMQAMGRQWESLKAGNAPAMRRSRFGGRLGRGIDRLRTGAAQGATRGAQGYSQWQARNKMESEHYADQQQEALLDRLSTDEAFRTAAAGGDAAAADRLAARADAQVHKRRIDDATARLRTLSRDERIALAHGRTVTTAAGHTIVPDVAMQEAAIKSVAPSMDSREALDLADALGGGHGVDAAVRRAGVESLAGKAPQLTGSQLGALEGDTYSRDAATLAGLTGGKFDADWMATKAKADDIDELVAHIAGTTDPAERARLQAIVDDAVGKLDSTDTLRARVVAGSDLDQALDRLASSRSIPTSGPSGGTPPPSGSSGTGTPP